MTFTFDEEKDKLFIKAQSENELYCEFVELYPLIIFDKIKRFFSAKNYKIIAIDNQKLEISIEGVIDLKLKNQDQQNLQSLKDRIQKLTAKV